MEATFANENPKLVGVADLPPCGFKTYDLKKRAAATKASPAQTGEIANERYSVKWDSAHRGFALTQRDNNRTIVFRPFSGEIVHVKETGWEAPNSGANFRAKDFTEVSYSSTVEAAGPICHALAVRGNVLTFNTTDEPGAWVTARAVLYHGIQRVDIDTELHTYPQMGFHALAELEIPTGQARTIRDFPFGEEESHNEQFSALNYVRIESPDLAVVVAHGGTQQFFCARKPDHVVLRNMIAHSTLKGSYRWHWSITTGPSFTPAESYRFAEASWGPIVQQRGGRLAASQSWVTVNDPAIVVFRIGAESGKLIVWLMNFSDEHKAGELKFTAPVRACRQVNLEGQPMPGASAALDPSSKTVKLDLSPWEIAALDFKCE
jgi:hypothetical protein